MYYKLKEELYPFSVLIQLHCCLAFLFLNSCSLFYNSHQAYVYQVQKGDTLFGLSESLGVSMTELMNYNDIRDPDSLRSGQILEIPVQLVNNIDALKKQNVRKNKEEIITIAEGAKLWERSAKKGGLLQWPVVSQKARFSSKFGWRWKKFHEGIDIAGPIGIDIYAAHDGKVVVSGYQLRGYGKMLIIQKDNLLTVYAHNDQNLVKKGQYVKKGQKIAELGNTGRSTGPHLHFEVRFRDKNGKFVAVNPLLHLP